MTQQLLGVATASLRSNGRTSNTGLAATKARIQTRASCNYGSAPRRHCPAAGARTYRTRHSGTRTTRGRSKLTNFVSSQTGDLGPSLQLCCGKPDTSAGRCPRGEKALAAFEPNVRVSATDFAGCAPPRSGRRQPSMLARRRAASVGGYPCLLPFDSMGTACGYVEALAVMGGRIACYRRDIGKTAGIPLPMPSIV
jgi:hypothetical protein